MSHRHLDIVYILRHINTLNRHRIICCWIFKSIHDKQGLSDDPLILHWKYSNWSSTKYIKRHLSEKENTLFLLIAVQTKGVASGENSDFGAEGHQLARIKFQYRSPGKAMPNNPAPRSLLWCITKEGGRSRPDGRSRSTKNYPLQFITSNNLYGESCSPQTLSKWCPLSGNEKYIDVTMSWY